MKIPNPEELQRELLGNTTLQDLIIEQEFTSRDIKIILRPNKQEITFSQLVEKTGRKAGTVRNTIMKQYESGFNYCKIGRFSFTFELLNRPWSEKIHNK